MLRPQIKLEFVVWGLIEGEYEQMQVLSAAEGLDLLADALAAAEGDAERAKAAVMKDIEGLRHGV